MTGRRARRMLAGVVGLSVLVGVAGKPPVQPVEALFTDSEYSSATIRAELKPPTLISVVCVRPPLAGGPVVTIQWRWPTTVPYSGFTATNARWKVGTIDPYTMPTTGPVSGVYTSTITTSGLGSLLGSLLGANLVIDARATTTTSWTSLQASSITYNAPLLGGDPTCPITNR